MDCLRFLPYCFPLQILSVGLGIEREREREKEREREREGVALGIELSHVGTCTHFPPPPDGVIFGAWPVSMLAASACATREPLTAVSYCGSSCWCLLARFCLGIRFALLSADCGLPDCLLLIAAPAARGSWGPWLRALGCLWPNPPARHTATPSSTLYQQHAHVSLRSQLAHHSPERGEKTSVNRDHQLCAQCGTHRAASAAQRSAWGCASGSCAGLPITRTP